MLRMHQFNSVTQSFPTLRSMNCSMPGFPVHHQLLELAQTHVPSIWWCRPIISSSVILFSWLQSFPVSGIFPTSQFFTSGDQSIGASASASVLPMNMCGISVRIDWFDLLAVQRTLKNLLQHHRSKASILWRSAFFSPTLTSVHDHRKNHNLD